MDGPLRGPCAGLNRGLPWFEGDSLPLFPQGVLALDGQTRQGNGPPGWSSVAEPPSCADSLAPLPSGRALSAGLDGANIYDPNGDRWLPAPAYRFPHGVFARDSLNVILVAPTPDGAILIDRGLNGFSSAERFLETHAARRGQADKGFHSHGS